MADPDDDLKHIRVIAAVFFTTFCIWIAVQNLPRILEKRPIQEQLKKINPVQEESLGRMMASNRLEADMLEAAGKGDRRRLAQLRVEQGAVAFQEVFNRVFHRVTPAVADALLAAGADPNVPNDKGIRPLHQAIYNENREAFELLLTRGADLHGADREKSLLAYALDMRKLKLFDELLAKGADPNGRAATWQDAGVTPLMCAYSTAAAVRLLDRGADPNARSDSGRTPLMYAAQRWNGPLGLVQLLVERGAKMDAADDRGSTVLAYALANDFEATQEWLRSRGAQARYGEFARIEFAAISQPSVSQDAGGGAVQVRLPAALGAALASCCAGFRLPEPPDYKWDWFRLGGAPFLALGDLDRDGAPDITLLMVNSSDARRWRWMAFHSKNGGYVPYLLDADFSPDMMSPNALAIRRREETPDIACAVYRPGGIQRDQCWENGNYVLHQWDESEGD